MIGIAIAALLAAGQDHGAHRAATAPPPAEPASLPAPEPSAPAPPSPDDHYAERIFPAAEMAAARAVLRAEHGGGTYAFVSLPIAEVRVAGEEGFNWDGEAWYGGDRDRLAIKTEGEGAFGDRLDSGEAQLLYTRPIDPYWNLQIGARQDFGRGRKPSYAVLAVEGLAPYWFKVEGSLFISTRGEVLGRAEASYDQRITQRLILQPRVEFNLAAQNVRRTRIGAGLSEIDAGLRLRYEIVPEVAPYVGIDYERRVGRSAKRARVAGEDAGGLAIVIGIATFF